ncbi:MAG: toprim domain-containing protein [Chloroflexi bacterium]|nr:toprim domain-containing protein [Chloroflexota bacterium]
MTTQNTNGKRTFPPSSVEDHPQWRAYLAKRHVLEAAVAAGAWVEHSDYYGRHCLVWQEKRRDGSRGARRRRFINPPVINGKEMGKSIWFSGEKTNEPFHSVGTLDDLKAAIARSGGIIYIVEGEIDVWSMRTLGFPNTVGIYGISLIPKDIASILDELEVAKAIYLADNDKAGERGASKLATLLLQSAWTGKAEYRKITGPGVPEKGDANDLLCHHYPDIAAARAALGALRPFEPDKEPKATRKSFPPTDYNGSGWDAVNQAITDELGLIASDFKPGGYTRKNFHCLNPQHEDRNASAGWSRDGSYKCFVCGKIDSWQVAEWLNIDWRALRWPRPQPQIASSTAIDLNAAPQADTETAPLSFEQAPDSWLRLLTKFHKPTEAPLFLYALRFCQSGPLAGGFTRDEFIHGARPLGCNLQEETIKKFFKNEVFADDDHAIFAKVDPGNGATIRKCKFRLRDLDDIWRRLMQGIRYRVYEKTFQGHDDILIEFKVFAEALTGSEFAKTLQAALEPLYRKQEQRFASLKYNCERKTAAYEAELEDLYTTPLPDWSIEKPCELPAMLARGIYDAEPEDRSKREWARLLGISRSNVDAVLGRAGIQRTAYIIKEDVNSQPEAWDRASELGAKIIAVDVGGAHEPYDAAMDIRPRTSLIFQPTARHEIVSDEKQKIKAPAKSSAAPARESARRRAGNMRKPGNWTRSSWDPQFIYWELVKACCLLHGYVVRDGIGIYDPDTGEVWTNPTLDELVGIITGSPPAAKPDPG